MAEQLPVWLSVGIEPPEEIKEGGWQPGVKPAAQHMNWLYNRTYMVLLDHQNKLANITTTAIDASLRGKVNGIAGLNAQGKVIDASGNEVEGKVKSVNGMTGDVTIPKEIIQSATAPTGAKTGDLWLDTSDNAYQDTLLDDIETHLIKKASPTTLGHVMAETDEQGRLIFPEQPDMTASNVGTTSGSNVQTELDNLKSSVSSGKQSVRDAITGKGGTVADSDGDGVPTYQELVGGVGTIKAQPRFVYKTDPTAPISGMKITPSYQRWGLAKDTFFSRLDGSPSTYSFADLINNVKIADITAGVQPGLIKTDSHDDDLYCLITGLARVTRNGASLDRVWEIIPMSGGLPCLALSKDYVYFGQQSNGKIYKINRQTGIIEITSIDNYSFAGGSLTLSSDGKTLIATYNPNTSSVNVTLIDPNTLTIISQYANLSIANISYIIGAELINDMLYIFMYNSADYHIYIYQFYKSGSTFISNGSTPDMGRLSSDSLYNGSTALLPINGKVILNLGNYAYLLEMTDTGISSYNAVQKGFNGGYARITDKRFSFLKSDGNLYHGTIN